MDHEGGALDAGRMTQEAPAPTVSRTPEGRGGQLDGARQLDEAQLAAGLMEHLSGEREPIERQPSPETAEPVGVQVRPSPAGPATPATSPIPLAALGGDPVVPAEVAPVEVAPAEVAPAEVAPVEVAPRPAASADDDPLDLLDAVELLRGEIGALKLPLAVTEVEQARAARETLVTQLDDYLLPRLRRMDAPVLAVVGGSTGAGKSTLVNSLVRREVSKSGVLRPTTRSPVLVHNPYDSGAFLSQRILPGLARVTQEAPEPAQPVDVNMPRVTALRLVPHDGMPAGIAIVDAPDIDSLVQANRELAAQLLNAADLWIFVTTAARYGDAMPWDMLRHAVALGVSVAVVLDRVPPPAMPEIRAHLATLLRDRGLATSPVFTIPETSRSPEGFLPKQVVEPLLGWLTRIARDARSRDVVIRRTLVGALDSLRERIPVAAKGADDQEAAAIRLHADAESAFGAASDVLAGQLTDGTVVRGEVLARWQEFLDTGEVFRSLEAARGDGALVTRAERLPTQPLDRALQSSVQLLVRAIALRAAEDAVSRWRAHPAGAALLAEATPADPPHQMVSAELGSLAAQAVQQWRAAVVQQVAAAAPAGEPARSAVGVDGAAVLLMLLAVGHRADPRRGPAAEPVAVARHVLEALFDAGVVRDLVAVAAAGLQARAGDLLGLERRRVEGLLISKGVRVGRGDILRAIGAVIEGTR